MIIDSYKGYDLRHPQSGGKAGKGYNLSSTIQVMKISGMRRMKKKEFRFIVSDPKSKSRAISRAKKFIDELCQKSSS